MGNAMFEINDGKVRFEEDQVHIENNERKKIIYSVIHFMLRVLFTWVNFYILELYSIKTLGLILFFACLNLVAFVFSIYRTSFNRDS
ncbi:hypothetical protein HNQ88_003662 [Aureibacter tunicatorum]|uniref:Uncharacterized protein n=1 Tax=Aureibacter tunicatorum TaxID=866807 RepID=A0AAE3XRJ2_9BACT|nr:hypothetical protein [Aureibacter tunicatorum]BDD06553.1 hypothetical protein AUTU_40360 [Aureibacter tunicatorum]